MSFIGGFGPGLASGLSSGLQIAGTLTDFFDAKALGALQTEQAAGEALNRNYPWGRNESAVAPVKTEAPTAPATPAAPATPDVDLRSIPHPSAPPRQALGGPSPNDVGGASPPPTPAPGPSPNDVGGGSAPPAPGPSPNDVGGGAAAAAKLLAAMPKGATPARPAETIGARDARIQAEYAAPAPDAPEVPATPAAIATPTLPSRPPETIAARDARVQAEYAQQPPVSAPAPAPTAVPAPPPMAARPGGEPAVMAPQPGPNEVSGPALPPPAPGPGPEDVGGPRARAPRMQPNYGRGMPGPNEAGGRGDAPQPSGLGHRILGAVSMFNPISSAQAAEPAATGNAPAGAARGAPPASSAAAPGSAGPGATGALAIPAAGGAAGLRPAPPSPAAPAPAPAPAAPGAPAAPAAVPAAAGKPGKDGKPGKAPSAPITYDEPPPARVELPQSPTPVVAGQVTPTTASEPAPVRKPMLDPRPMKLLERDRPDDAKLVQEIAARNGVSPERLAWHWWGESRLKNSSPNSGQGARGIMQVLEGTQREVDPRMQLDPNKKEDSLEMGARYLRNLDRQFGNDSYSSVAAYHGGPAGADAIAAGKAAEHPRTVAYANSAFPGQEVRASDINPGVKLDLGKAREAAEQNGPAGVLHYIANAAPRNMALSDKWRALEHSVGLGAALRGQGLEGVAKAQGVVFQLSHVGATEALGQAYKAMQTGDGYSAAQYLAKAHAYFPDDVIGQFGVDSKGQVWGQRVDEHTGKPLGGPFQIRTEDIAGRMIQSRDPNEYAKMLDAHSKHTSEIRLQEAHGDYYRSAGLDRAADRKAQQEQANQLAQQRLAETKYQHDQQAAAAEAARVQRQAAHEDQVLQADEKAKADRAARKQTIDTEIDKYYGPAATDKPVVQVDGKSVVDTTKLGIMAEAHRYLREGGDMAAPAANHYAEGLASGKYGLLPLIDPRNPGAPPQRYAIVPGGTKPADVGAKARAILNTPTAQRIIDLIAPITSSAAPTGALDTGKGLPPGQTSGVPSAQQQQGARARIGAITPPGTAWLH